MTLFNNELRSNPSAGSLTKSIVWVYRHEKSRRIWICWRCDGYKYFVMEVIYQRLKRIKRHHPLLQWFYF